MKPAVGPTEVPASMSTIPIYDNIQNIALRPPNLRLYRCVSRSRPYRFTPYSSRKTAHIARPLPRIWFTTSLTGRTCPRWGSNPWPRVVCQCNFAWSKSVLPSLVHVAGLFTVQSGFARRWLTSLAARRGTQVLPPRIITEDSRARLPA